MKKKIYQKKNNIKKYKFENTDEETSISMK